MHPRIPSELVDRMMELYCDWRSECAAVWGAYDRFSSAPATDRALAYAAYAAALDREGSACDAYAAQVRLIVAGAAGGARVPAHS
jgi:hypothetical protein